MSMHYYFHCPTVDPSFNYSNNSSINEIKTALRYHDIFLNCSFYPTYYYTLWEYGPNHALLDKTNRDKYAISSSGLTIYNVTNDDEGQYVCLVGTANPLTAFISLVVTCKVYIFNYHMLYKRCLSFLQGLPSYCLDKMRHW